MPVHDWTRVDAGIFHDFHLGWIGELRTALNCGLLPPDFYALVEQHAGRKIPDLLALHAVSASGPPPAPATTGGLALAEAPPRVSRTVRLRGSYRTLRRTLAIRHVSGHRLVAVLEIVSPGNKDRRKNVEAFAEKIAALLDAGINALLVDVFPPGTQDPRGMHGAVKEMFGDDEQFQVPEDRPLTQVSYEAGPEIDAYLEYAAIGRPLPDMPLVFSEGRYINVPLESTYLAAYRGMPAFWCDVLERPASR